MTESRRPVLRRRVRTGRAGGGRAVLLLALVLTLVGATLTTASLTGFRFSELPTAPPVSAGAEVRTTPTPTVPTTTVTTQPTAIVPATIEIPAIGVDDPVTDVRLDANRRLQVPPAAKAGWWEQGARPGAPGVAVVVGHVDSKAGPAVFYRLKELSPGQLVHLEADDGRTVTYRIDKVRQYAKDAFPTQQVYGPTEDAQLRLITCGGTYDRSGRGYLDNVVVYASLATGL